MGLCFYTANMELLSEMKLKGAPKPIMNHVNSYIDSLFLNEILAVVT